MALIAGFSYYFIFYLFPETRDIPWVNLLLFGLAGFLLARGILLAYRQPERYRGKISGGILGALTVALFVLFCYGNFVLARELPSPDQALRVGQTGPDFTLADTTGKPVSLSELRDTHKAVLLIFYRGYW